MYISQHLSKPYSHLCWYQRNSENISARWVSRQFLPCFHHYRVAILSIYVLIQFQFKFAHINTIPKQMSWWQIRAPLFALHRRIVPSKDLDTICNHLHFFYWFIYWKESVRILQKQFQEMAIFLYHSHFTCVSTRSHRKQISKTENVNTKLCTLAYEMMTFK